MPDPELAISQALAMPDGEHSQLPAIQCILSIQCILQLQSTGIANSWLNDSISASASVCRSHICHFAA